MTYQRRPPRVMHGASKLLAQARDISGQLKHTHESGNPVLPQSAAHIRVSDAEAKAGLDALVHRVEEGELRVARVRSVCQQIRSQCEKQAPGPIRDMIARVVKTFEDALVLPPRDNV